MSDQPSERNTYELIGRVTVAWNDVELLWMTLYLAFLDAPRKQADAAYHSLKVFAAQREITYRLGMLALEGNSALLKELGDLYDETGKASGDRNAVSHAKYIFGLPENKALR